MAPQKYRLLSYKITGQEFFYFPEKFVMVRLVQGKLIRESKRMCRLEAFMSVICR